MARINLLPWREERRERRRRHFLMAIGGVAAGVLGAVLLADHYIDRAIDRQVARNNYVGAQVTLLNQRIAKGWSEVAMYFPGIPPSATFKLAK